MEAELEALLQVRFYFIFNFFANLFEIYFQCKLCKAFILLSDFLMCHTNSLCAEAKFYWNFSLQVELPDVPTDELPQAEKEPEASPQRSRQPRVALEAS